MVASQVRIPLVFLLLATAPAQETPPSQAAVGVATSPSGEMQQLRAQVDQLQRMVQEQARLLQEQQIQIQKLQLEVAQGKAQSSAVSPGSARPAEGPQPPVAQASERPVGEPRTPFGKIRFNGLLQGWFASGDEGFHDTFRLRRAELKLSGDITPKASWTVMIDPAKALSLNQTFTTASGTKVVTDASVNQASRILQDAFITLDYIPHVHLDVGQYKVPLSLEGLQSSASLETVERAMFAFDRGRGGTFGDVRDLGVMIRGPISSYLDYQLGLFNGSGESQNEVDKQDQKAVIGRVVVHPGFLKGLQLGGSGAWGNGQRPDRPRRDRLGGELLYTHHKFTLKSEIMSGKDAAISRLGYYGLVGYKLRPNLQAVFRFDVWDPNTQAETDSSNVTERDYVAGFNYFITEKTLKLQVNYARKTFQRELLPSRNLMLVNLQTAW